ncbi:MAG: hypothetical protein KatS3mg076_0367 [Candidatus Binatia bacterium]|nr:MAG: hypothetical protein KatS3mg076_0367 [Candidatus Binatia bacterium]
MAARKRKRPRTFVWAVLLSLAVASFGWVLWRLSLSARPVTENLTEEDRTTLERLLREGSR